MKGRIVMKVNEAPEKIWINPATDLPKLSGHIDNDNVEYTRTDAFIEKACDYVQKNLWRIVLEEGEFRQRFVTDFKNYMKGE